jgi:F-box and WD-40 domain protein CDC4
MSAMAAEYRGAPASMLSYDGTAEQDIDMQDAGPSTAPLQGGSQTFFRDD